MLVPEFWAESSAKYRKRGNQVTIRRFGWSNESQQDAEQLAETRAQDALLRVLAGEKLIRREPKIPYNGAEGVPIREEVVQRQGDTVVTRNTYGARCLNTPDVLFADIDFNEVLPLGAAFPVTAVVGAVAFVLGAQIGSWKLAGLLAVVAMYFGYVLTRKLQAWQHQRKGSEEQRARERIDHFVAAHPDWHLRLYRTPAGIRALAMHRTFDPGEAAVAECFRELGVDPLYAQMCLRQQCFRARISPKPWRIGIAAHMRPRPGVWPINPERMPERAHWIEDYERLATGFASCRLIGDVGSGNVDSRADEVRALHDEHCRSDRELPLA
jgi:hypothetical protein